MDFKIYEIGDGGEINIKGGDIEADKTLFNAIYLSLFSGDNWYNKYNDYKTTDDFENSINDLIVNSNNLREIESIAKESLNWLIEENIVDEIEVSAFVSNNDKIGINILIIEPQEIQKKYILTWENQKIILKKND